ncbi:COP9 signalosome complex subunit 6 [Neurospora sp. IMI 360204]|nr:COP9 signalosome complex subunit 6 [Neurospora sp. IMI 360204]
MAAATVNPLMSTQKSDSSLQVALHPLPILEISDYITRSYLRGYQGAIVGALIGQQNGRQITIEHSFSVKTEHTGQNYKVDSEWFTARLEQMKAVHKDRALDFVGWYTLVPKSGPADAHLPIHNYFYSQNESAVLLGFHIQEILNPVPGDPLPLTIYESNLEVVDGAEASTTEAEGEDKEMKDVAAEPSRSIKFRELPYTTETGEAEMIALEFVREGGSANVTSAATNTTAAEDEGSDKPLMKKVVDTVKGSKRRAVSSEDTAEAPTTSSAAKGAATNNRDANLTKPELDYMSALQAKYNAVQMMKKRLDTVISYLQRLPPDYLPSQQTESAAEGAQPQYTVPSNKILRQIQALVTNVQLAMSNSTTSGGQGQREKETDLGALEKELLKETNDVKLVELIADLMSSVKDMKEVGKKFHVVETAKNNKRREQGPHGPGGFNPNHPGVGEGSGSGSGPGDLAGTIIRGFPG